MIAISGFLLDLGFIFREEKEIFENFQNRLEHHIIKPVILLCLCFSFSIGQIANNKKHSETGRPFIKYYSPKVYDGTAVNWTIAQDKRGVMYFGNGTGILEFDGTSWRKIKVPNSANVRSLVSSDNGIIYVCASDDFGYLKADTIGQLKYQLLKPYLDRKYQNYGEMWDVSASSRGIFFKTKDKIFKWDGHKISVIDSVFAFRLYRIGDSIYSRNHGTGLMIFDGDSLKFMPDGGFFSSTGVFNMLPFDNEVSNQKNKILVATSDKGLFLHDGKKFFPFKTNVDSFLIKNQIYNSCITEDGNYAFATQRGGVVIIDPKGRMVQFINEDSGLPTNVVYDVYSDRRGGLWLATLYGIVYCETPSPFSIFHNYGSLKSMSNSVIRFDGNIYAANEFGVVYLADNKSTFKLVKGINKPAYKLLNYNGLLFAGTNRGLATIEDNRLGDFLFHRSTQVVLASKVFPGRIYVGSRIGFAVVQELDNRQFHLAYKKETVNEVLSIAEDKDGSLWLAGYLNGIFHITGDLENLAVGSDKNVKYKFYDSENGLPGNSWYIYDINNKMLLITDKGIFRFDKKLEKFLPDSTLGSILSASLTGISLIEKGINGNLWIAAEISGENELGKAILQQNGSYIWQPVSEFRRLDLNTLTSIYSDYNAGSNTEILWVSTNEALVRYNPNIPKNIKISYSTLIRKAYVNNDSLIYGGASIARKGANNTILPFNNNNVSFEFSAVCYEKPEANLYQYYLEGNDEGWSKWTNESRKEYTNLSGGDYKFHVRSKNVYGITSTEDVFNFTILPPWYISWWAYLSYALLFLGGVFVVDRFQRKKVIRKERERAKLREAELIKNQADELETIDNIVRMINRELALENLLQVLLEQGMKLFPQSDTGALLVFDQHTDNFKFAATIGYDSSAIMDISFTIEEITGRYADGSEEVEKGVFLVRQFKNTENEAKFKVLPVPKSLISMSATWDGKMEGIVVFANLSSIEAFDLSDARKLRSFREHTISAIAKARILKELQDKNKKITKAQKQLATQEKLASLGQLTAGIAHEIKNPLNFVNNFSELSLELMQELRDDLARQKDNIDDAAWQNIANALKTLEENSKRINEHGKRADSIVRSMLQHSRGKSGERRATDINAILDENINFVYHGLRAQDATFNIIINKDFDSSIGNPKVIPQNISRVFLNILQNAFYAAHLSQPNGDDSISAQQTKALDDINGRISSPRQEPTIWVKTKNMGNKIEIRIRDNGPGIPEESRDKIFNPFFSTKPSGKGTGLGLSIAYDIVVKEHGGEISFEIRDGQFTEFIISLPYDQRRRTTQEN